MAFDGYNDYQMKEYASTQALLKYRRGSMPLMYGDFRTLYVDDEAWVFLRHYMGDWAVVAINVRGQNKDIQVCLPEFVECDEVEVAIATEGGNAALVEGNTLEVAVPAYGYVILNN